MAVACASFGFVYLHPFLDGNGRLHRFIIHQVLAASTEAPTRIVLPISAVIAQNLPDYLADLTAFSAPVTALWDYRRTDIAPHILSTPGARPYRFFCADQEVRFLHRMIKQAVDVAIPNEVAFLYGYDRALASINEQFDLPQKDISALIRMIHSNGGLLSQHRRKQYAHLPAAVLDQIEALVRGAFASQAGKS